MQIPIGKFFEEKIAPLIILDTPIERQKIREQQLVQIQNKSIKK